MSLEECNYCTPINTPCLYFLYIFKKLMVELPFQFFTLVLLTFIIELAGAVLAFVFLTPIQNEILTTMGSYNETDESNPITQAWDTLQQSVSGIRRQ